MLVIELLKFMADHWFICLLVFGLNWLCANAK
jgi:hypothetical protein